MITAQRLVRGPWVRVWALTILVLKALREWLRKGLLLLSAIPVEWLLYGGFSLPSWVEVVISEAGEWQYSVSWRDPGRLANILLEARENSHCYLFSRTDVSIWRFSNTFPLELVKLSFRTFPGRRLLEEPDLLEVNGRGQWKLQRRR